MNSKAPITTIPIKNRKANLDLRVIAIHFLCFKQRSIVNDCPMEAAAGQ